MTVLNRAGHAALAAIAALFVTAGSSEAELPTYTFPVCGAPDSVEPGWVPSGDPNVNGEITLTINSLTGTLSLYPSEALPESIRYATIHAHLCDLKKRCDDTAIGQSTICRAHDNTEGERGGVCAEDDDTCQALTGVTDWPWEAYGYHVDWYRDYLMTVANEGAEGWWLMLHFAGGHFATDDDFLDTNGKAWVDENGNLTEDTIAMGYDLETQCLFDNDRDNG